MTAARFVEIAVDSWVLVLAFVGAVALGAVLWLLAVRGLRALVGWLVLRAMRRALGGLRRAEHAAAVQRSAELERIRQERQPK